MTPENKDVAGLLPSSEGAVATINGDPATAHSLLAALVDIHDDEQNKAPEDRCYVESAWGDCMRMARTFLAAPGAAIAAREQEEYRSAMSYASSLATALFKSLYAQEPDYASGKVVWGLCDTLPGVLTQIDNMVSGLIKPPSRDEAPVASGEPTSEKESLYKTLMVSSLQYFDNGQPEPAAQVLRVALGRQHDALASPSGAGLGGAVASSEAVDWLRNNYQDYPNIASLCDAMTAALASQPGCAVEGEAVAALRRLERAVDMHLGRSASTQTTHLKGIGYSEKVRQELFAAHDAARAALQVNSTEMTEGAKGSATDGKEAL